VGFPIRAAEDVYLVGQSLLQRLDVQYILLTMGSRGLTLFDRNAEPFDVPAIEVPVYDVAGAGDTVASAFTLALSAGAHPHVAAELANIAGGAVVRKLGVATTNCDELLALAKEMGE